MTAAAALITAIGGLVATLGVIGLNLLNLRAGLKREAVEAGRKAQVELLTQLLTNKAPTNDTMIQTLLNKMGEGGPDEHA